ncbi:hypothetical protein D3C87_1993830 [compost metagenome]
MVILGEFYWLGLSGFLILPKSSLGAAECCTVILTVALSEIGLVLSISSGRGYGEREVRKAIWW